MREIKFRAWHKKEKMIYEVLEINIFSQEVILTYTENFETDRWEYLKDIELMQFTGLKDKNGKEIYEGDIIRVIGDPERYEIFWNERFATFELKYTGNSLGYTINSYEKVEVIGNIYENPELLNEQKGDDE